jgi:hypothetical protein
MHEVPGEVKIEELKKLAKENGGVIKYWLAFPTRVDHRFFNAQGQFSWTGEEGTFIQAGTMAKRFTNYWHAYAYSLKIKQAQDA